MRRTAQILLSASVLISAHSGLIQAHDPVFGIGPHVLFRDGVEVSTVIAQEKAGLEKESELALKNIMGSTGLKIGKALDDMAMDKYWIGNVPELNEWLTVTPHMIATP